MSNNEERIRQVSALYDEEVNGFMIQYGQGKTFELLTKTVSIVEAVIENVQGKQSDQ